MKKQYSTPKVKDLGNKWKVFYWDYSSAKRCAHTKELGEEQIPDQSRGSAGSRSVH